MTMTSIALNDSGPGVLFKTCVAMKFVDDDDDDDDDCQEIEIALQSEYDTVCKYLKLTCSQKLLAARHRTKK